MLDTQALRILFLHMRGVNYIFVSFTYLHTFVNLYSHFFTQYGKPHEKM